MFRHPVVYVTMLCCVQSSPGPTHSRSSLTPSFMPAFLLSPALSDDSYCVFTSPSCSTWRCSFVSRVWVRSAGNSTLAVHQLEQSNSQNRRVRESLDQGELMLDLPALRLGSFFGPERKSTDSTCHSSLRRSVLGELLRVAAFLEGDL